MRIIHSEIVRLDAYRARAPTLVVGHCYGSGNPFADLASRGRFEELHALAEALRVDLHRVGLPPAAVAFAERVRVRCLSALEAGRTVAHGQMSPSPFAQTAYDAAAPRRALLRALCGGGSGDDAAAVGRRAASASAGRDGASRPLLRALLPRGEAGGPRLSAVAAFEFAAGGAGASQAGAASSVGQIASRSVGAGQVTRRPVGVSATAASSSSAPTAGRGSALLVAALCRRGARPRVGLRDGASASRPPPAQSAARARAGPEASRRRRDAVGTRDALGGLVARLRGDDSPYALKPRYREQFDELLDATADAVERAGADSVAPQDSRYFHGYWASFCADLGTRQVRDDAAANAGWDVLGRQREVLLQALFVVYVHRVMRPRRRSDPAARPDSAVKVLLAIRRVHAKLGFPMAPMNLVRLALDGLNRRFIELYGESALIPVRAEPYNPEVIEAVFSVPEGTVIAGRALDWRDIVCRSWQLGVALTRDTGFRKGEICPPAGSPGGLSRDSVVFRLDGRLLSAPTARDLRAMRPGRDAVGVKPPLMKNDQFGLRFGALPAWVPLVFSPHNAAALLIALELSDPIAAGSRASTPLIIGDQTTRAAMTPAQFDNFHRAIFTHALGPDLAKRFTAHSGRVELACRLLASGASPAQIQAVCRWCSDDALKIYARLNASDYEALILKAQAARIDSVQTTHLPTIDISAATAASAAALAAAIGEGESPMAPEAE